MHGLTHVCLKYITVVSSLCGPDNNKGDAKKKLKKKIYS